MSVHTKFNHYLFFITSELPHRHSGGAATIFSRLLDNLSPEKCFVMGRSGNRKVLQPEAYQTLVLPPLPIRGERFSRVLTAPFNALLAAQAAKSFKTDVIVGTFPDDAALLTSYLTHKLTRIPLVVYFVDLYLENKTWFQSLANWLQPRLFREATVISLTPAIAELYLERYNLQTPVIPTCINIFTSESVLSRPTKNGQFVVGFSGTIGFARMEGLQLLVKAIGDDPAYQIRLFTPSSRESLQEMGLWRDSMELKFVHEPQVLLQELQACDALYLPLTFQTDHDSRDQLATCFGTKCYDYMLTGRPIVVQSPPNYYTAEFLSHHHAALVVGEPTQDALLTALTRLRQNEALQIHLSTNAWQVAHEFEGTRLAPKFLAVIDQVAKDQK